MTPFPVEEPEPRKKNNKSLAGQNGYLSFVILPFNSTVHPFFSLVYYEICLFAFRPYLGPPP